MSWWYLNTLGCIDGVDPIGANRIMILESIVDVDGFNMSCCCSTGTFFASIIDVDKGIFVCGGGDGSLCSDECDDEDNDHDDSSSSDWMNLDISDKVAEWF